MNSFSGQVIHHKHSHFHIYATSISFQDSLCERMERQEQMTLMNNVNPPPEDGFLLYTKYVHIGFSPLS
jgi:hypothetical protein